MRKGEFPYLENISIFAPCCITFNDDNMGIQLAVMNSSQSPLKRELEDINLYLK